MYIYNDSFKLLKFLLFMNLIHKNIKTLMNILSLNFKLPFFYRSPQFYHTQVDGVKISDNIKNILLLMNFQIEMY